MRFGSLFSGIGGLDLGLERAGMECAWQVEIDDWCRKVLTTHWPDVPKYGDIKDVGKSLEPVDLICGGFPCQPFSVAGKREGTEDDRHLWPEMLRVISELKPTWVLGENVPGIIPIFLDQAILDLEAEGYTCESYVFPACAFDAYHRRDRLFIIAYANSQSQSSKPIENKRTSGQLGLLVDPNNRQCLPEKPIIRSGRNAAELTGKNISNSNGERLEKRRRQNSEGAGEEQWTKFDRVTRWLPEPSVGRVANGVPHRVDRLRGLGNAVVPQVAEFIGKQIMGFDNNNYRKQ